MRSLMALFLVFCPFFPLAAGGAGGDEWRSFTSEAGRFTVRVPGKPTQHTKVNKSPAGDIIDHVQQV